MQPDDNIYFYFHLYCTKVNVIPNKPLRSTLYVEYASNALTTIGNTRKDKIQQHNQKDKLKLKEDHKSPLCIKLTT